VLVAGHQRSDRHPEVPIKTKFAAKVVFVHHVYHRFHQVHKLIEEPEIYAVNDRYVRSLECIYFSPLMDAFERYGSCRLFERGGLSLVVVRAPKP
jgi:hypothetical protein